MSSTEEEVAREQSALLNDFKVHGPHVLHLKIQRTSDGDCGRAASNSEETWKSAEMPEVRDEEIDISYQKKKKIPNKPVSGV